MTALRTALSRASWPGALWGAACLLVIGWDRPQWPGMRVVGTLGALLWIAAVVGHAWPARRR